MLTSLRAQVLLLVVSAAVVPSLLVGVVLIRAFSDPIWIQQAIQAAAGSVSEPAGGAGSSDLIGLVARYTVEQPALRAAVASGDRTAVEQQLHTVLGAIPLAQSLALILVQVATTSAAVSGLTVVALAAGAGGWFARRLTQPLVELRDTVTDFAAGEWGARAPVAGGREVRDVAVQFNRLADELVASQRELEQRVTERTEQLLGVMRAMSDGLLVVDQVGRIDYANPQAARLLGDGELSGALLNQCWEQAAAHSPDGPAVLAIHARALAQLDQRPVITYRLGDPPVDVRAAYFPIAGAEGGAHGLGIVMTDVTAEHDLQRTKDELVSVVSHELRTPLASLVGFAELMLGRDFSEARQRQFLTVMLQEGRRLTSLINDFLDLQRLESGRQQLRPVPTSIGTLILRAVTAAGEDPQHPVELDVPETLPLVYADPDRIQQVLMNLLSNARKYSPNGGPVRVTATAESGWVVVAVADEGLGLPPEAQARLFEKFYRVDNSDRREIKGTGLGLAIVKQIVEAHGGLVRAESPGLGQGSRLVFTLPQAESAAAGGEVLIVEDDPGFARLLEAELATHELSVVHAGSAETALQVSLAGVRAIILDLRLPGLQGEELLHQLRAMGGKALPVVVVTVVDVDDDTRRALQALGVAAILAKGPSSAAEAAAIVARSL